MRKVICLLLFCGLIYGIPHAKAESAVPAQGASQGFRGYFWLDYCEETDTYWAMIQKRTIVAGAISPLLPQYCVYRINSDFSKVEFVFSTRRRIYSLLPIQDGLLYELEVLFDPLSADIMYYNSENGDIKKCLPFSCQSIVAYSNHILYYQKDRESGIFAYSLNTGLVSRILKDEKFIACDSNFYYYLESESGKQMRMSFHSQESEIIQIPENIKLISGDQMLDQNNGILYLPENKTVIVEFVKDALSVAMDDYYLCALDNSAGDYILTYVSVGAPEIIHKVTFPSSMDSNINLCNGKVFFYNKLNTQIAYVDLDTCAIRGVYIDK